MANRHRGERFGGAVLDGRERTLCLTLGALAELEAALRGATTWWRWRGASRRANFRRAISANIIGCGLRGAGEAGERRRGRGDAGGGRRGGFARIAAELIRVTFGAGGEEREGENPPPRAEPLGWDAVMAVWVWGVAAVAAGFLGDDAEGICGGDAGGVAEKESAGARGV